MRSSASSRVALVGINRYGLRNLAAVFLRNWAYRDAELKGVAIEVLDLPYDQSPESAARQILSVGPSLVGFTCFLWNVDRVLQICRSLKRLAPGIRIALGGPEIAPVAGRTLEAHPEIDFAACGEGEEVFRGLLHAWGLGDRPFSAVPGLAYRDGGRAIVRDPAPLIDLSLMPPVYAGGGSVARETGALLESSRGCPFLCSFCDWGPRKMRYVSLLELEREFQALVRRVNYIWLCDADPLMDRTRGQALLDMFSRVAQGSACTLHFEADPAFLTPEVVEIVARDPARFHMSFGIQSVSPEVLKEVRRHQDLRKVEENLTLLRRRAPQAQYSMSLVYGLPGDDLEKFRRTLDWVLRWPAQRACASQLMMIPGADLGRETRRYGIKHQTRPPYQVYETATMGRRDMKRARELAFYNEMLHYIRPCFEALFGEASSSRYDAPAGSRVARLESWIERLKSQRIDLTFGAPVLATDEHRLDERSSWAADQLRQDKLLVASVLRMTRAAVETHAAHR